MSRIWSALVTAYTRWRFVEDADDATESRSERPATETPEEEIRRLRRTIAREQANLADFRRYDCGALASPLESSIRAMESRIRALEMRKAI